PPGRRTAVRGAAERPGGSTHHRRGRTPLTEPGAVRPHAEAGAGADGGATDVQVDTRPPAPSRGPARSPVTPHPVLTVAATLAGFVGALYLLYLLSDIVRWALLAAFLAVAMGPLVGAVQRLRIPRVAAVLLSYGLVLALVLGAIALLVPVLMAQVGAL